MSLHLFSTPVECTQCGTVVDDPTAERCPDCAALLKERRAPRRLAGVERRYDSLRVLIGALRAVGVIVLVLGGLVFFSSLGEDGAGTVEAVWIVLGSVAAAVALFALGAGFDLAIDLEENTRASFRVQQLILEEVQERRAEPPRGGTALRAPADPPQG